MTYSLTYVEIPGQLKCNLTGPLLFIQSVYNSMSDVQDNSSNILQHALIYGLGTALIKH